MAKKNTVSITSSDMPAGITDIREVDDKYHCTRNDVNGTVFVIDSYDDIPAVLEALNG